MTQEEVRQLSNQELLEKTRNIVNEERRISTEILRHIEEIDRRRLYATLGFRSLFDFCVRELKYSESSAWRRISAMRLIKDVPEAEQKIANGTLSLTSATTLQKFIYTENRLLNRNMNSEAKKKLVEAVENKSSRETEKLLAEISPASLPQERTRTLDPLHTEIKFVADQPLMNKLEHLKDLNSHRDPSRSYAPLFDWISDVVLKHVDPLSRTGKSAVSLISKSPNSRSIPWALRQAVWKRDGGTCSYIHPETQRRCDSTRFLEIDHIQPFGLGGKTELDNLRLYCRTHNQHAARATYGESKITAETKKH